MSASASPAPGVARRSVMPPLGEEHEELRASIRAFVERELVPHVADWERERWFPDAVFTKLAEHGFLGLKYPVEHGGQGGDHLHEAVLVEELARAGSAGLASGVGAHCEIATPPLLAFGTAEQKRRYLEPAIRGEKLFALAITEPEAGSDVAAIRTRATKVDGGWRVSGSKTFITNGVRADVLVCAVRTTEEGGHHGTSFLLVDRQEGVRSTALEKMGWHASDTALISLDDVFVPDENLLGEVDRGFVQIMTNFQWERLVMSLGAVAGMQAAFERTVAYVRQREAFGRPIAAFQVTRHRLADLETSIHATRCLVYDALRRFHEGEDAMREVTMAKLVSQRAAVDLMDACVQLHGGAGYMADVGIERGLRDARLGPIGGGTDEIMREILGRTLA